MLNLLNDIFIGRNQHKQHNHFVSPLNQSKNNLKCSSNYLLSLYLYLMKISLIKERRPKLIKSLCRHHKLYRISAIVFVRVHFEFRSPYSKALQSGVFLLHQTLFYITLSIMQVPEYYILYIYIYIYIYTC